MIPLVALSGALSAVDKLSSVLQHLSSPDHAGPKQTGRDFAAILAGQSGGTAAQGQGVGSASSHTP